MEEGFLGEFANANRLSHRCMEWGKRRVGRVEDRFIFLTKKEN